MTNLAKLKSDRAQDAELRQMRVDLAAAFRLAAAMNWHESVGNHFSLAVSPDGKKFLMNPRWKHFSLIRASDLLLLDSEDPATMTRADAPDPSAWCIHGRIHANLAHARCLLHLHPPYATALVALADPELKPIDQNTARFYNPEGSLPVAVVSVEPAMNPDEYLIRFVRGPSSLMVSQEHTYGPYPPEKLATHSS